MKSRTLLAVEQQIEAMDCEVYEIGLFKPNVPGSDSKEPEMLPRTWDSATLLRSVPWLRYQNSQSRNIYIRPSGEHQFSMVDDLTANAIKRMRLEGFGPTLVGETSPGNFQAWLNHGQLLPQRLSTIAARTLATKFGGDKGAADWRHFGRLAGFTNRKDKYQSKDGPIRSCGSLMQGRPTFMRLPGSLSQTFERRPLRSKVPPAPRQALTGMIGYSPLRISGPIQATTATAIESTWRIRFTR